MAGETLLIIDVQNAVLEDGNGAPPSEANARAFDTVVEGIACLLEWARARSMPVVFVQHSDPDGPLERSTNGWRIRDEIAPRVGEPVVEKTAPDSFFGTTLSAELDKAGAKTLIVAGCRTEYCIDTTVRRAVSLGYDVTLVSDGHMTADSGALTFDQIIAHHNRTLHGFGAGNHAVRAMPTERVVD